MAGCERLLLVDSGLLQSAEHCASASTGCFGADSPLPEVLSRFWCLWELYASQVLGMRVQLAHGTCQQATCVTSSLAVQEAAFATVSHVDVRGATAFVAAAVSAAKDRTDGLDRVNAVVRDGLARAVTEAIGQQQQIASQAPNLYSPRSSLRPHSASAGKLTTASEDLLWRAVMGTLNAFSASTAMCRNREEAPQLCGRTSDWLQHAELG